MWYLSSQKRALERRKLRTSLRPIVEDQRAPVGVLAQARVGVLVEVGAVEVAQAVRVFGEVGGHPVEEHADAVAGGSGPRST